MKETGWSVAVSRQNGSEFLCASSEGVLPPVWPRAQRKHAVAHKKDLQAHGFKARVVAVEFTRPVMTPNASLSGEPGFSGESRLKR